MFYFVIHQLLYLFFSIIFRKKTVGLDNLPPEGGAVLVANHTSYLDPPVLGTSIPVFRRVYFMAKKELFAIPLFGRAIRALGAFPVKQGGADRRAIVSALRLLQRGKLVIIFPEGTRNRRLETENVYNGAVLLAHKAKVPLVPIGVVNTDQVFSEDSWIPRLPKLCVNIGEPITVPEDIERDQFGPLTTEIMEKVGELISESPISE